MNKKQIYSFLAMAFFVIAVFQLADHGFTVLAITSLALGAVMSALVKKEKDKENSDDSHQE